MWGTWKQAPYLMSGGVVSFAAAIVVSKLFPTAVAEEPRRPGADEGADPSPASS
jgi:hypothetical protein